MGFRYLPVQLELEALENQRRVLGQSLSSAPPTPDERDEEEEGISELIISKSYMLIRYTPYRAAYMTMQTPL